MNNLLWGYIQARFCNSFDRGKALMFYVTLVDVEQSSKENIGPQHIFFIESFHHFYNFLIHRLCHCSCIRWKKL